MTIKRNKRRELKQTLLDLLILTEKNQDDLNMEVYEGLVGNVLDGRLQLLFTNNRCQFKMTPEGIKHVENMGGGIYKCRGDSR